MRQLELELLYVVTDASWHAAYDLRAESNDSGLDLTYYGVIINHSLDDWRDVPMSLSTAQPAIGSAPPHLPTKQVDIYKVEYCHSPPPIARQVPFCCAFSLD
jgi:hypothetical protein